MTDQIASTPTSGPTGYNATEISDLATLGAKVEDTIESLEQYISALDILTLWNAALDAILSDIECEFTYFNSPYYEERWHYALSLEAHGIQFEAFDRDHDRITFFMPFTFLSPETRPQCIEDLRAKYAALAEQQGKAKRTECETARTAAERALAKAQADLAALDQA